MPNMYSLSKLDTNAFTGKVNQFLELQSAKDTHQSKLRKCNKNIMIDFMLSIHAYFTQIIMSILSCSS